MRIFSAMKNRRRWQSAFTMMEIAISLAVIGIALVAIIGILPLGLRTQRENRERTLINQDASVFMELIRNGIRATNSPDADLTNYVFAVTNYQTFFNPGAHPVVTNGFDISVLTNNYRIIGVLSTPEFTDGNGQPIPALLTNLPNGCYSNHIVAYIRSISGLAAEKPPQGNSLLRVSSFSYRVYCENVPTQFPFPPEWDSSVTYNQHDKVFYPFQDTNGVHVTYWLAATGNGNTGQTPTNNPGFWAHDGYTQTIANSERELRLTFYWPLLPSSGLPPMPARQTYRTLVPGQLVADTNTLAAANLYFFQPQIFTNTP